MPSRRAFTALNTLHRATLRLTRGRLGWHVAGMDVVELTTTGRRTGRAHTVLLTAPLRVDGRPVLVASRGGDDRPPDWLLNLRAHPVVVVRGGGSRLRGRGRAAMDVEGARARGGGGGRRMRARVATESERAAWWPRIVARHPAYRTYQERTARVIPLVVLEREGPGRGLGD